MSIRNQKQNLERVGSMAFLAVFLLATSVRAIDVADTFSRLDNDDLGITEVGGFAYEERITNGGGFSNVADISGEQLRISGIGGPASSDPGQAIIVESLGDLDVSVDMRFGGLTDISLGSTYNSAGFVFRKPGTDVGISNADGNGQIGAVIYPSGGFLIRQNESGALPILYDTSPFDPSVAVGTLNSFAAPGTLPATIGGQPFDVNQNGVLEENEPFNLGASLSGDRLTMKINGEDLFDVTLPTAGPATQTSYFALMKNRHTGGGTRHNFNPLFDNLVISGTAPPPPPPPPPIRHVGDTNPFDEGWAAQNGGAAIANNGPVDDGGTPAWNIHDDSAAGGSREAYIRSLTPEQLADASANGWKMRGELRFIGANDPADGAVELSVYPDSNTGFVLWLGADEVGNPILAALDSVSPCCGTTETIVPGGGYHAYEMVFDPASGTVDIFVDDDPAPVIEDYAGVTIGSTVNRVLWGSNDSAGMGNANYRFVEFTIVPEPSSLALVLFGVVAIAGRRAVDLP